LIMKIIVGTFLCFFFAFWFCLFSFGGIVGGTIGVIKRFSLNKTQPESKTKKEKLYEVAKIEETSNLPVPNI